ncbi:MULTISPECIES: GIY-YIG nuclease family protein [unclassified Lysobacter]|uniref:GIY-YIG nuclease family protein n=1 Tax=unclassified Lysobacter TaxID=2635362 RepID=UPI00138F75B7|nr:MULTISPECIES: GIY-YIG nuclease family protein [unclassified Lysobacter]
MMVVHAGGATYCKVGVTGSLWDRICQVQTGCPVRISDVAYVAMATSNFAYQAERRIHWGLNEYHSHGEWFALDLSNEEHKAKFSDVCRRAFGELCGSGWRWVHQDLAGIKLMAGLRLDKNT